MKNLVFAFSFCLLITFESNAQYHHFIEPDKIWKEKTELNFNNDDASISDIEISGDIVIGDKEYKIIGDHSIREDTLTKKVYIIYAGESEEHVLYDFSLEVDDEFYPVNANDQEKEFASKVLSITNYEGADGKVRKLWNFSSGTPVIEGIGSSIGFATVSTTNLSLGVKVKLVCVHREKKLQYLGEGDLSNYCTPFASNSIEKNIIRASEIKIYPNPVLNKGEIQFENSTNAQAQLRILNALGQEVRTYQTTGSQIDIVNDTDLNGTYFYHLTVDNNLISTGKLIFSN